MVGGRHGFVWVPPHDPSFSWRKCNKSMGFWFWSIWHIDEHKLFRFEFWFRFYVKHYFTSVVWGMRSLYSILPHPIIGDSDPSFFFAFCFLFFFYLVNHLLCHSLINLLLCPCLIQFFPKLFCFGNPFFQRKHNLLYSINGFCDQLWWLYLPYFPEKWNKNVG